LLPTRRSSSPRAFFDGGGGTGVVFRSDAAASERVVARRHAIAVGQQPRPRAVVGVVVASGTLLREREAKVRRLTPLVVAIVTIMTQRRCESNTPAACVEVERRLPKLDLWFGGGELFSVLS
jgi:hypothetical protein